MRPNIFCPRSSILAKSPQRSFQHPIPLHLILLPPPPTPHTSKKARHRLIRTPNLHLPKIRHRAITLFIRAHDADFFSMLVAFCAAEHVFGGFARKVLFLVVGTVEREGVGAGAAGEVVGGEAGVGEGDAGYGEHV